MAAQESPDCCPQCGAEVPPNAKACPECGSDEQTGWSDRAHAERLDLPQDGFNYDEFVQEEFGETKEHRVKPRGITRLWWVVAIVIVLIFLMFWFR